MWDSADRMHTGADDPFISVHGVDTGIPRERVEALRRDANDVVVATALGSPRGPNPGRVTPTRLGHLSSVAPDPVRAATRTMARNAAHLARLLRAENYPAAG